MIEEREIWACANQLLRQHGNDAWFVASTRADALLAEGQLEGHRTFIRILERIKQLEQLTPANRVHRAMPMGTRHRLSGMLLNSPRGLILEVDDGGVYALDADRFARKLLGQRVTIKGTRSGFDCIDVEWIGVAPPR